MSGNNSTEDSDELPEVYHVLSGSQSVDALFTDVTICKKNMQGYDVLNDWGRIVKHETSVQRPLTSATTAKVPAGRNS